MEDTNVGVECTTRLLNFDLAGLREKVVDSKFDLSQNFVERKLDEAQVIGNKIGEDVSDQCVEIAGLWNERMVDVD
tara:strand:+ start:71 stop:298 length:228 start_codon:yes stop_codon:yes gene_type:complete